MTNCPTGKECADSLYPPIIPGFERGSRIDRALNLAIAEMYLQGVSTRKVAKAMNEICGGKCLTVIDCPPEAQRRLRTSNIMASINRQLKRRTNVISIFPSEASLLRIVTAKAMALSDEWEGICAKAYISPEKLQQAAEALQAASSRPANPAA